MKYLLVFFMLFTTLFAQKLLQPQYKYKLSSGLATGVVYEKSKLYISSDSGNIDIFNTKSKKKIKSITLSKIKDFMGDEIYSKIFTIDLLGDTLLILSQDNGGYSRIQFYHNNKLISVINQDDKLNIIKAQFVDKKHLLIALISNEIILYDIQKKKKLWTTQASMSKFSDFAINNDRSKVAVGDESGDIHVISTTDGTKLKTLTGQNVDNIFSVDFKGDTILTGGQDRRAAVYNLKTSNAYYKASTFFVYGVGLSPSGQIGAYSCDMKNDIELFNTQTRASLGKYQATNKVLNSIYFINEKEFFVNSNADYVLYYKIK